MMTSRDIHGPLVNPRRERLWTWVDPLGFRSDFRYEFEMDLLDAFETESQATVRIGEKVLQAGSTFNDFYGFGTSRNEAIREAERYAAELAGAQIDVIVTTTLITRAVFIDDKREPFYSRSVRCFEVPSTWRRQDSDEPLSRKDVFQTWSNGAEGADEERLARIISEARSADCASDRRSGPLL